MIQDWSVTLNLPGKFKVMYGGGCEVLNFPNPSLDVLAVWVEPVLLSPRIEDSEPGLRVASGGCAPLPVTIIN